MADRDALIKGSQFTKTYYRDVYPSIDPTSPSNSQAGKVIVITGAGKGIGREVSIPPSPLHSPINNPRDSQNLSPKQDPRPSS